MLGLRLEKDKSRAAILTDLLHKKQDESLEDIENAGKDRAEAWVQLVYVGADGQRGAAERQRARRAADARSCSFVLSPSALTRALPVLSASPSALLISAGTESNFRRTVNSKGVSSYYVDDRKQSAGQYKAALEAIGIWVEAKNFLVFQVQPRRSDAHVQ